MTPSPPLAPHLLAMVKSPGPFLLSVVVTVCSVECVLLHTNATDGDATLSIQHVPDHPTSVATTSSFFLQGDQLPSPDGDPSFTGAKPDDVPSFTGAKPDDVPSFTGAKPDDVPSFTGAKPDDVPSTGAKPDDVPSFTGDKPDDVPSFTGAKPDDVPSFTGAKPDDVPSFTGAKPDDVPSFTGAKPDDVPSSTGDEAGTSRYGHTPTDSPYISSSDTLSGVDDKMRSEELPEDVSKRRLHLLTRNENREENPGNDERSSRSGGEAGSELLLYKPDIVRNVSQASGGASGEGVKYVVPGGATVPSGQPLEQDPQGQRTAGTLHLSPEINRLIDEILSGKTRDDKRTNDRRAFLSVEHEKFKDKDDMLGKTNAVPYIHDLPRVHDPVHDWSHRDDTKGGHGMSHVNSPTGPQVGDPPHVDRWMSVDGESPVEDSPLNGSSGQVVPAGAAPRRVASVMDHFYDYSLYQGYSSSDYDSYDLGHDPASGPYVAYHSGSTPADGYDNFDHVAPCCMERCLCTVLEVTSEDSSNSTGDVEASDLGYHNVSSDLSYLVDAEVSQRGANESYESAGDLDLASGARGHSGGQAGYEVHCNASASLRNLSTLAHENCNRRTIRLQLTQQLELCRVTRLDFQSFQDLTYLSITHSALTEVEDGAFGNLPKLETLDLSHNQLHVLSWRTIWPTSLPGDHLRHINTTGNPLVPEDCRNAWLLAWRRKRALRPQAWREVTSDGGVEAGSRREADAETTRDATYSNKTTNSTTDDCPAPGTTSSSSSSCFLCPAALRELSSHKGQDVCETIVVECSVRGQPAPQIEWRIPDHLMLVEKRSASGNGTVNSTLTLAYNTASSHLHGPSSQRQPLLCLAQNDRYVSVEEIDISTSPNMDPRPKICWTEYDSGSSPEKFNFAAQAAPSYNVSWWFSPCVSNPKDPNFTGEKLIVYFTNKDPRSSYVQGYLLFPSTSRGTKRGDYEIRISNQYGVANESKHISRRKPNSPACPTHYQTQLLPHQETIPTPATPSTNTQAHTSLTTSCPLPTTTISTLTVNSTLTTPTTPTITTTITTTETPTIITTSTPTTPPPSQLSITLTIGACAMVMVIGITLLLLRNLRRSRGRPQLDSDPCPDSPFQITFMDEDCHKKSDGLQLQELMPLSADRLVENPEYIGNGKISPSKPQAPVIPRDHVKFVSELGEGAFGRVYLGIMDDGWSRPTQVAVKTLKSVGPEARQELEREVELLNNLKHKNIVSFYGVCYNSDPLLMVFEYMEHGDLNNYLRSHNEDVALLAGEETTTEPLSVMDCLQIALQVAAGMKYLASQHYVHRDLATRNCLVGSNLVVKIGDFGMSRDVYTTDYYQFGGRTLLPVRWMPPESILYRRFTIESDIWSFGVVLWEIFTGGKQPWYGYTNQEVITQITAGRMLSCPDRCPPDMYSIMLSCWAKNPQERLPMATLYDRIRSLTTVEPHVLDYD